MHAEVSIEATCPECRGPLSVIRTGGLPEIRCLVGHAYSVKGLLSAHCEAEETALWAAIVALRETAKMVDALADQFPREVLDELRVRVEKKQRQADQLEHIIRELEPLNISG